MEIRIPRPLAVALAAVLVLTAGTALGAVLYHAGPYRELDRVLASTRAELESTRTALADREREVARLRAEVLALQKRAAELEGKAAGLEKDLSAARAGLQATQQKLSRTEAARRAAEQREKQQKQVLLTRERDIYVLRTCLAGVTATLSYVLDEDYDGAAYAIRAVERECRAASKLLD